MRSSQKPVNLAPVPPEAPTAAPAVPGSSSGDASPQALTLSNGLVPPRPRPAFRPLTTLPGAFVSTFSDYLAHPALGRSTLDKIRKSPRNLQHYLANGDRDTSAFLRGRVAHRLLLEPKQFWLETVVWRGGDKAKGAGSKTRWEAFKAENADKDIITEGEERVLLELEELFRTHPQTRELLVGAHTEVSAFFERDGVQCKLRADIVRGENFDELVDVKTTHDLAEFERSIYKYGYHRQGEWYMFGASRAFNRPIKSFRLVVVEIPDEKAKTPVDLAIFRLDDDVIEDGREENDRNLGLYKRCQETGKWPGFAATTDCVVSRPAWRS